MNENEVKSLQAAFIDAGNAAQQAYNALCEIIQTGMQAVQQAARIIAKYCDWAFYETFVKMYAPNKRVAHLALYAKKERVRKKNYNRVRKEFAKKIKEREKND